VDVVLKEMTEETTGKEVIEGPKPVGGIQKLKQPTRARPRTVGSFLPIGQTPVVYLKRLLEHFVTHRKGFEAVEEGCQQRIRVEMYPLAVGWTVFARYSGNGREERVDQLHATELSQFAERAVTALLKDVPISGTINRNTVLKSDSTKAAQRIKGTNHWTLCLGTQVRGGQFDTLQSGSSGTDLEIRLFTPMTIATGYRGKFESWGVEAMGHLGIGTSKKATHRNPDGGHIDYGGNVGVALHFLHYTNPRGLTSFYLGSGATFELLWFSTIKNGRNDRSTLYGGGLDVDLVVGWEFMRANAVQFFLQGVVHVPAYMVQSEDNHGSINTWFPSASVNLGMVF
jgi:hypothetical protein